MRAWLKKVWHDPVWSKVISAGVIAAITGGLAWWLHWWPSILTTAEHGFALALGSATVPLWLLLLLSLCALLVALRVVVALRFVLFPSSAEQSDWRNYVTDTFFGLRWFWSLSSDGQVRNLYPCCPKCAYQVMLKNVSAYAAVPRYIFCCDSCNETVGELIEDDPNHFEEKVKRFIQQKLRNGTWKAVVTSTSPTAPRVQK